MSDDAGSSPHDLTRAEGIELLGQYRAMSPPRWQNLQAFVAVFITVDLTVLGASAAAFEKFTKWSQIPLLLVGPITAFVFAVLAKQTIRKQEAHIREIVMICARLEEFLDLHRLPPVPGKPGQPAVFWPGDVSFFPDVWMQSRTKHATSTEFIQSGLGGTSTAASRMFLWIQLVSIGMTVLAALWPLFQ